MPSGGELGDRRFRAGPAGGPLARPWRRWSGPDHRVDRGDQGGYHVRLRWIVYGSPGALAWWFRPRPV